MSYARPKFYDSKYFYYDENEQPALKEGAPKEEVDELKEYLELHDLKDIH